MCQAHGNWGHSIEKRVKVASLMVLMFLGMAYLGAKVKPICHKWKNSKKPWRGKDKTS